MLEEEEENSPPAEPHSKIAPRSAFSADKQSPHDFVERRNLMRTLQQPVAWSSSDPFQLMLINSDTEDEDREGEERDRPVPATERPGPSDR